MIVTIEKLDHFGRGLCKVNDKVCFVEGALPGEEVEIDIIKENKNFIEAKVLTIINESEHRITPKCPYYDACGGCTHQHMTYELENESKVNKVKELMERFAHISPDLVKDMVSGTEYNYRNKIILHGLNGKIGFYEEKTHSVIPIKKCLLVSPKMNNIIKILNKINVQILEVLIRCSNDGEMTLVELEGKVSDIKPLQDACDILIYNGMIMSEHDELISKIGDKDFFISYSSFFQVNRKVTKKLYDRVLKEVKKKKPNKVLDLYCGAGTIGIYVSDYAKEIIGVDNNGSNIVDANKNKELNHVENISFICDKVENKIDSFTDIDMIIVDPPRSGLDTKTKEYLTKINPETIVYVSCDPVTLARDLGELNNNYEIKSVEPFNMFPRSSHVECVCILERI